MAIQFSLANYGIVEQTRKLSRFDAIQWPAANVANSCNNRLDKVMGYGIKMDKGFPLDDSNHPGLPIGTTATVEDQKEYSFLTDDYGNTITTLTRIDLLGADGIYHELKRINQGDIDGAIDEYQKTAGTPNEYMKLADNVIRLFPKPSTSIAAAIKYYFQRSPKYYVSGDTTKTTGFAPELDRGFVVESVYDAMLALGSAEDINKWAGELAKEDRKMDIYFSGRNRDGVSRMTPTYSSSR